MLTKKYVYGSLALAVMLACSSAQAKIWHNNTGSWAEGENFITSSDIAEVFSDQDGKTVTAKSSDIKSDKAYGVLAYNNTTLNVLGTDINISSNNASGDSTAVGARTLSDIKKEYDKDGNVIKKTLLKFTDGGTINIGDNSTKNINLTAKASGSNQATGIFCLRAVNDPAKDKGVYAKPSFVNIEGENLNITANSKNGMAVGIWAQNNTGEKNNESTVTINAKNTVINVTSGDKNPESSGQYKNIGIVAYSSSKVNINNNLTINAGTAISTRGYAQTVINKDGNGTVKINGDINFNYDKPSSGTAVDATVDINLTNKDSFLNGNIFVNGDPFPPEGKDKVNAMNLSMKDGASWTSDKDSFVNNLTLDGGIITAKNANQTITVGNLTGKGGDINLAATTDGNTIKTSTINITGDVSKDSHLNANLTGITADDIKDADNDLASLNEQLKKVDHTNNIAEGDINGAITQNVVNGDTVTVTTTSNTKIDGFNEALILATAQWRHELNSLSKRLGELRSAKDGTGVWARAFGSEYEYGNQTLTNNTIQIGSDFSVAEGFKLGGAVSYTDGSTSAFNGSADNDIYSVALYGTYMAQNGVYVDVVGKYSNITNDFSFQNFTGSYDNDAYSLSLESGWHLKLNDTIFVEPQAEFIYGKILGDDFTASNGVKVHQEDTDALILRGGMRAGFYLPENKGLIYAKASVVHDYDSETKFTASKDGNVTSRTNDLGGTWAEYGIGANINWTDNCYTYFEIERTSGSDLVENYRWNIGTRYVF